MNVTIAIIVLVAYVALCFSPYLYEWYAKSRPRIHTFKAPKKPPRRTTSLGPPASAEHARSRIERMNREEDKKWIEDLIKEHSCKCGCKCNNK